MEERRKKRRGREKKVFPQVEMEFYICVCLDPPISIYEVVHSGTALTVIICLSVWTFSKSTQMGLKDDSHQIRLKSKY